MNLRHLRNLGDQLRIPIPEGEDGLTGRECPNQDCLGFFRIQFGTGLKGENLPCHCPYCGHVAPHDQFFTEEQIAYAHSVAINTINNALRDDVREWDRELRHSTRNGFIKLSVEFKSRPYPIHYYREEQLETEVICDACTLRYTIYGVFGYCPDCGSHNSLQILGKNLDVAEKQIALSLGMEDKEFSAYLIANALEDSVSAFDGFGREACRLAATKIGGTLQAQHLSFQNLSAARQRVQQHFGFDFAATVIPDEWAFAHRCFQKRHLLAHKMGVVDQKYIDDTRDATAIIGRKVSITPDEVKELLNLLRRLGAALVARLP